MERFSKILKYIGLILFYSESRKNLNNLTTCFSFKDFCDLFFGKNSFKKSCSVQKIFKKNHFVFNVQKRFGLKTRLCDVFSLCYDND